MVVTLRRLRRPDPVPPEPTGTKGDRTRHAILAAAVIRFAREGYRGTSVADACRDAGLSTTASYPYFANKEALFVAAVDEDVAGLIDDAVSLVVLDEEPDQWGRLMFAPWWLTWTSTLWPTESSAASSPSSPCGSCTSPHSRSCARP